MKHRLLSGYKSQRSLARKTNISPATISRIEAEIQLPEVKTLLSLSKYLFSTSYQEMLNVCGYADEEVADFSEEEPIHIELTKAQSSSVYLLVDGNPLTEEELKWMISLVRAYRE